MGLRAYLAARRFRQAANINRALASVTTSRIADALDGSAVKIAGEVRYAGAPLYSPLTRRRCAFYRAIVEQGNLEGRWIEIAREEAGQDFVVYDGSGNALVGRALIALRRDAVLRSDAFREPTEELELFLGKHGKTPHGIVFAKNLRYTEAVLEAGDRVAVAGHPRREPDPDPGSAGGDGGYREVPTRLVFRPAGAHLVLASEDPSAFT
jgi:hypothetical protein